MTAHLRRKFPVIELMFNFLATEPRASFFNDRFKVGLEMNSPRRESFAMVAWKSFNSFSTLSKDFCLEAAE